MNGFWLNKTIADWQAKIPGIIHSFEDQISDINKAKSNASSGRVGHGLVAQNAAALLSSRLNDATIKKANWDTTIRNRVISLQRTGYQIDNAVAQMVADSQVAFFNTYSWLRPEVQTSSFWNGWNEFWGSVGETLSNAWQGIKNFFTNSAIFQIVVSGLEVVSGVVVIAVGGVGAILSAGTATPLSIAAIAGGLAMIAHGSGGLQEGIQVYSGDETPSNWLKDMVGETAYNIIGIGGAVVSVFATGGISALVQLGAGMGVGMGSSWIAENVFGCDSTVSQWIGLSASLFAAWGAGKALSIKNSSRVSPRQSEIDVAKQHPTFVEQKTFMDGQEVPYGTKGSSRPDLYRPDSLFGGQKTIEVKNYDVSTAAGRNRLISNVVKQTNKGIKNLPNTSREIVIDVRGQNVSNSAINYIKNGITSKISENVKVTFVRGNWGWTDNLFNITFQGALRNYSIETINWEG